MLRHFGPITGGDLTRSNKLSAVSDRQMEQTVRGIRSSTGASLPLGPARRKNEATRPQKTECQFCASALARTASHQAGLAIIGYVRIQRLNMSICMLEQIIR